MIILGRLRAAACRGIQEPAVAYNITYQPSGIEEITMADPATTTKASAASSEAPNSTQARHGIISLTIKDKAVLYAAYMPFIKNGGLFIPTAKSYKIGDEVFMLLRLMDEVEKVPAAGKVIWITPKAAHGNRPAGIGVQLSEEEGSAVRDKIEGYLAGMLGTDKPTHTL